MEERAKEKVEKLDIKLRAEEPVPDLGIDFLPDEGIIPIPDQDFSRQPKDRDRDVVYEIRDHLGILSTSTKGWKKELNMVAWNGTREKFDLRDWNENHKSMGRGVTLNKTEMKNLRELIKDLKL